jgi:hypothetical protein
MAKLAKPLAYEGPQLTELRSEPVSHPGHHRIEAVEAGLATSSPDGAGGGNRTHDLTITSRLRYQLRHTGTAPVRAGSEAILRAIPRCPRLCPPGRGTPDRTTNRKRLLLYLLVGRLAPVVNVPGHQRKPSNGSRGGDSRLPPFRAGIVIVVFVAATVLLLGVIHPQQANVASGSTTPASSDTTTTTAAKGHAPTTTTTTIPPSQVAVVVANASGVTGAAAAISARLAPGGWHMLPPVNASSDVSTSSVYYVAGQQKAAASIAASLQLPASSVVPYTTAAPVPSIGTADVVVVAGPDVTTTTTTTAATAG